MKINIKTIKNEVGASQPFDFITTADQVGLDGEHLWIDGTVSVHGEMINNGRAIEVAGVLKATAKYECDRCLTEFERPVEIPFSEVFQENVSKDNEAGIFGYAGNVIDLSAAIRENVIMSRPLKTFCSAECRGLCPKCGTNLNVSSCACERDSIDPRLAALQKIFDK